jgi:methylated-DNA-[protein]-cysteine S-methyltransferase
MRPPSDEATLPLPGSGAATAIGCGYLEVPAVDSWAWLAWTGRGLSHLLWAPPHAQRPSEIGAQVPESGVPANYARLLTRYFAGEPLEPVQLPIDLQGTPFQLRVWEALRKIPRGAVRSYAGIAADIGSPRATRAVGMANASNPVAIVVPCHRVVEKDLSIGGYSGGLPIKRFLLGLEGVDVRGDQVRAGQLTLI